MDLEKFANKRILKPIFKKSNLARLVLMKFYLWQKRRKHWAIVPRELVDQIGIKEIKRKCKNAKTNIKDWTKRSTCNKGFTKGAVWNILAKDFDINHEYHILAKTNMIREFGEFLPGN
jgi:phage terminase large subunit-like protein